MAATNNTETLPLDRLDHNTVSDSDLMAMYDTCPVVWQCGSGGATKVVRVSQTLVLKGKSLSRPATEGNVALASRSETFRVPKIHRVFHFQPADEQEFPGWYTLMDYVPGRCVRDCWEELDEQARGKVAEKVARAIVEMQSRRLDDSIPPGPIDRPEDVDPEEPETFKGPWFSEYGAGPFASIEQLEGWCNHKLNVCLHYKKALPDTPHFEFKEGLVLTHQDISPRNLVLEPQAGDGSGDDFDLWILDWEFAGAYPPGFEQAALQIQSSDFPGFADLVLGKLPPEHVRAKAMTQRRGIDYGLTTGAFL